MLRGCAAGKETYEMAKKHHKNHCQPIQLKTTWCHKNLQQKVYRISELTPKDINKPRHETATNSRQKIAPNDSTLATNNHHKQEKTLKEHMK